jgi:hypothetical protein
MALTGAQTTIDPETPERGVWCYDCDEFWSPDRMYRRRKRHPGIGLCSQCQNIRTERGRINREAKRAADSSRRRAAYTGARSSKNPQAAARHRELNYGLQEGDLNAMIWVQDNRCAICGEPPDPSKHYGVLVVDHCHETNKVRGLLCAHCNSMLGYAKDEQGTLLSAAHYLESAPA